MMQHQFNEVFYIKKDSKDQCSKIPDSRCCIFKPLIRKNILSYEKVNLLFHSVESQHFIFKVLAFFFLVSVKENQF